MLAFNGLISMMGDSIDSECADQRGILCGLQVFDNQLRRSATAKFIDVEPVDETQAHAVEIRRQLRPIECNRIGQPAAVRMTNGQLQMRILQDLVIDHLDDVFEHRFWKALTPWTAAPQLFGERQRQFPGTDRAPSVQITSGLGQQPLRTG